MEVRTIPVLSWWEDGYGGSVTVVGEEVQGGREVKTAEVGGWESESERDAGSEGVSVGEKLWRWERPGGPQLL